MPRGKKTPITIGIFGLGETPEKNLIPLLSDYVGDADVDFVIPATKDHFSNSVETVMEWLDKEEIRYDVITDDSSSAKALKNVIKNAENEIDAEDVGTALVNALKDADDGRLLVFWDGELGDEDGGAYQAIVYADENDIPVFDLCDGLSPVDLGGEPEPEEEKPARGRRARKDEDSDDDDAKPEPKRRGRASKDEDAGGERKAAAKGLPSFTEAENLGVRALRTLARDTDLAPSRTIGSMGIPELLDLLYPAGDGDGGSDPEPEEKPRRGRKAESIEQEVAAGQHKASRDKDVYKTVTIGDPLAAFIDMLATRIAEKVAETLDND